MLSIYSQISAMESHEPAKANPNKPGATPCGLDAEIASAIGVLTALHGDQGAWPYERGQPCERQL